MLEYACLLSYNMKAGGFHLHKKPSKIFIPFLLFTKLLKVVSQKKKKNEQKSHGKNVKSKRQGWHKERGKGQV